MELQNEKALSRTCYGSILDKAFFIVSSSIILVLISSFKRMNASYLGFAE
ncbi:hypothetical protein [Clostridium sp. 1001275B_160808_H3]|nr:hypothetical protein [Clostridium sp. 1001275B_160808_H3]